MNHGRFTRTCLSFLSGCFFVANVYGSAQRQKQRITKRKCNHEVAGMPILITLTFKPPLYMENHGVFGRKECSKMLQVKIPGSKCSACRSSSSSAQAFLIFVPSSVLHCSCVSTPSTAPTHTVCSVCSQVERPFGRGLPPWGHSLWKAEALWDSLPTRRRLARAFRPRPSFGWTRERRAVVCLGARTKEELLKDQTWTRLQVPRIDPVNVPWNTRSRTCSTSRGHISSHVSFGDRSRVPERPDHDSSGETYRAIRRRWSTPGGLGIPYGPNRMLPDSQIFKVFPSP